MEATAGLYTPLGGFPGGGDCAGDRTGVLATAGDEKDLLICEGEKNDLVDQLLTLGKEPSGLVAGWLPSRKERRLEVGVDGGVFAEARTSNCLERYEREFISTGGTRCTSREYLVMENEGCYAYVSSQKPTQCVIRK